MSEKVYPDWIQKQKTTGTTVKKVGNNYYLYKPFFKTGPWKEKSSSRRYLYWKNYPGRG